MSLLESSEHASLQDGQVTGFHWSTFTGDPLEVWLEGDGFLLFNVDVPAFSTCTLQVRFGATVFRQDIVINNTPNVVPAGISGAALIRNGGKRLEFNDVGGNPATLIMNDGFWNDGFSAVVSLDTIPPGGALSSVVINQVAFIVSGNGPASYEGNDHPEPPTDPVVNPDIANDKVDLSWTLSTTPDVVGYKITRSDDGGATFDTVAVLPPDITTFNDYFPDFDNDFTFYWEVWSFHGDGTPPNSGFSEEPIEYTLEFIVPDILHQGNIILDIALAATLVFSVNPSGIYTLVKNKRHDTLYERLGAITTVEVAIPDPFFKTGFIGDQPSGEY